jgi:heme oxygenase
MTVYHGRPAIINALKADTQAQHQHLEDIVSIEARIQNHEDYCALLTDFYSFYQVLETALTGFDWKALNYDFEGRRKCPRLLSDLKALGVEPHDIQAPVHAPQTPAQAFGALYVLEGATLGGQIITRQLIEKGYAPETRSFFGGYGADNGRMWQDFQMALANYVNTPEREAETMEGARQAFADMANWLSRDNTPKAALRA